MGLWFNLFNLSIQSYITHLWPISKSKFNLKSDRVNLVAPASPIECLLYIPNVRAIQYKLGPERLTRFGNSNGLGLPPWYRLRYCRCRSGWKWWVLLNIYYLFSWSVSDIDLILIHIISIFLHSFELNSIRDQQVFCILEIYMFWQGYDSKQQYTPPSTPPYPGSAGLNLSALTLYLPPPSRFEA